MKKVTVYGTLGPACRDYQVLKDMIMEGMDGIRLNLSHTSLSEAADMIESYHSAALACGVKPELLVDLQGPELRIGRLERPILLNAEDYIPYESIPFPVEVRRILAKQTGGQEILLDDGKILLRSEAQTVWQGSALRVIRGGKLESRKSVALPGQTIDTAALTEFDMEQIRNARAYGVTGVMQPFVRSKEDLIAVRNALNQSGCRDICLFAKIENLEGVARIEELIPNCDQIVIARGDLGNAMELWELPACQKQIAACCRRCGRDFMVVTQMLDSMTCRPVPTRAEVSDIFNAVLDGAASVMVTGETAAGAFPVLTIRYLVRTVRQAEKYLASEKPEQV